MANKKYEERILENVREEFESKNARSCYEFVIKHIYLLRISKSVSVTLFFSKESIQTLFPNVDGFKVNAIHFVEDGVEVHLVNHILGKAILGGEEE